MGNTFILEILTHINNTLLGFWLQLPAKIDLPAYRQIKGVCTGYTYYDLLEFCIGPSCVPRLLLLQDTIFQRSHPGTPPLSPQLVGNDKTSAKKVDESDSTASLPSAG
jgi:hypothetical protein